MDFQDGRTLYVFGGTSIDDATGKPTPVKGDELLQIIEISHL